MSEDTLHCPRCGEPYSELAITCPGCGAELSPHLVRMRCNYCGRRIPADATLCPRCGQDPASHRQRFTRVHAVALGALLLVCCGWVLYRAAATRVLDRLWAEEPAILPTPTAQIVYVVATPVPTVFPTRPPADTPAPTAVFTPTAAAGVSPAPTRRGARTETPTVAPPTPTPTLYPGFALLAPEEGAVFAGSDANITLEWQKMSAAGLKEDEWYMIAVSFTAREGGATTRIGWSRETRWRLPAGWWSDAPAIARSFQWNVTVVRIEGSDPFASAVRQPASPPSATRMLIWN